VDWREIDKRGWGFTGDWALLVNPDYRFLIDGHQLTVECELATSKLKDCVLVAAGGVEIKVHKDVIASQSKVLLTIIYIIKILVIFRYFWLCSRQRE
jgi:hypothetical protein